MVDIGGFVGVGVVFDLVGFVFCFEFCIVGVLVFIEGSCFFVFVYMIFL